MNQKAAFWASGKAPAGVVTTTRYGNELAWIGMMLVHSEYRRRGIATALMDAAINICDQRKLVVLSWMLHQTGLKCMNVWGFVLSWSFIAGRVT